MIRSIKFGLFFIALFFIGLKSFSQSVQSDYLRGKEYFRQEQYQFASEFFKKSAKEESLLKQYALFYFGLSSLKNKELGLSRSIFRQIETKYPKWNKISEVYFWLAKVYFEESDYKKGIEYAQKSKLKSSDAMLVEALSNLEDINKLVSLYHQFPDNIIIARELAKRVTELPLEDRDFQLLSMIVQKFDLNRDKFGLPDIGKSKIKREYKVAILFPFLFDGLDNPKTIIRNKLIMDLYEGIELAVKDLNQEGAQIKLYPYDTKRSVDQTKKVFELPEMASMDLIIGPLFSETFEIASNFALANKINIVHPLSTSSSLIKTNPFAFLFRATIERQAEVAAELMAERLENKNVLVFYESNPKDSISAHAYSQRMEELGFNVLRNHMVTDTTVRETFDWLTEIFEIQYTRRKADSVRRANPRATIKSRKSTRYKDVKIYYEELFKIGPDSIGHIYVASSKPLYASNYISAVEVRSDSIVIVGRGDWLDYETLTLEEIERLGIYLIDIDYCNNTSEKYQTTSETFLKEYRRPMTKNVVMGYEMIYTFGSFMKKYGHYFQNGTAQENNRRGVFFEGVNYSFSNSNQYVPILQLKEAQLNVINKIE